MLCSTRQNLLRFFRAPQFSNKFVRWNLITKKTKHGKTRRCICDRCEKNIICCILVFILHRMHNWVNFWERARQGESNAARNIWVCAIANIICNSNDNRQQQQRTSTEDSLHCIIMWCTFSSYIWVARSALNVFSQFQFVSFLGFLHTFSIEICVLYWELYNAFVCMSKRRLSWRFDFCVPLFFGKWENGFRFRTKWR